MKKRVRMSLRSRLLLLVCLAVVPALGLALYSGARYQRIAETRVRNGALQSARLAAAALEREFHGLAELLTALAQVPQVRGDDRQACSAFLRTLLQRYPSYTVLGVTDATSRIVSSALPMPQPVFTKDRAWFQQAVATRGFSVGSYQVGRLTGRKAINCAYPILDARGHLKGVVYAGLGLNRLERLGSEVNLPPDSTLTIVDRDGVVLMRYPTGEGYEGRPAANRRVLEAATAMPDGGTIDAIGLDGVRRIYGVVTLQGPAEGVRVMLGLSRDYAFAELTQVRQHNLILLGAVALLVLMAALLGSEYFVLRPLNALVTASRRLGAADLSARTGLDHEGGELGELARAFDEMATAMQRDVTALEQAEQALRREKEGATREAQFSSAVLGTLGALVVVLDTAGRIVRLNHTGETLTGYTFAEVEGRSFWDLFLPPAEVPAIRTVFSQLTAGQFPSDYENHWLTREGERRLIAWSNTCLVNRQGEVEHVIATGVDITEQRAAEERIVRLNAVLKAIRDVNQLIRVEPDRRRLLQACCEALIRGRGYTKTWLVTCDRLGRLDELYSEGMGDKSVILEEMVRHQTLPLCARGALADRDVLVWLTSGVACGDCTLGGSDPCATRMTACMTHDDRVFGLLCVCLPPDMEATAEEQELLRELSDDIGLAVHMLELADAEREAQRNLALERDRLGALYKLSEMVGASLQEITDFALEEAVRLTNSTIGYLAFMNEDESVLTMHSWSKTAMRQCSIMDKPIVYPVVDTGLWGEAVRQRQPVVTNDYEAPNPLKKSYPAGHVPVKRHMNIPVFDGERIVAVAGVGNKEDTYDESDILQLRLLMNGMWRLVHRKRAEEDLQRAHDELELRVAVRTAELARSNSELEQFAYVASHDLQEPLRKIQAFGDRLYAKSAADLGPESVDYLQRMQNASQRMSELINDLLVYSRVTTRAQPFVTVSLDKIAAEVLSDLEVRIQETGATVDVSPLPELEADPTQMRQLLQNLIANALKFHQADVCPVVTIRGGVSQIPGPVRGAAGAPRPMCQITVEDNGIGFEPRFADRVFGLFQRLHERGQYEGTGIGLALCRKIAEHHGGSITADSQLGKGTTFTVILPIVHTEGETGE